MAHGSNTIPIPGELRSVAEGNRAVAADGVYDYAKDKFQEQVNSEVDAEIQNIKGGATDVSLASLKSDVDNIKGGSSKSIKNLDDAIIAEVSARSEAVSSEVSAREQAISNEATARQNADTALGGRVSTLETTVGAGGSIDTRIATAVSAEKTRAEGAESTLNTAISTEKTRAEGVEATKANASDVYSRAQGTALESSVNSAISSQNTNINNKFSAQDAAIAAKQQEQDEKIDTILQQQVEVVDALPESGEANTIYRVPNQEGSGYSDYMWQNDQWKLIGTFEFPGIEDEPKLDSQNLVSSDGIARTLGYTIQNPEYISVTTDSQDHILEGIKSDGTKEINLPTVINSDLQVLGSLGISGATYSNDENPEWIQVTTDSEGKILEGITAEGKKKVMVETQVDSLSFTTEEGKELFLEYLDSSSPYIVVDVNGKGKYTSITEASAVEPAGTVFFIMPGVYDDENVQGCDTKKQHFIGIDRDSTIVKNHQNGTNNCVFTIGAGSLQNLTIIKEYSESAVVEPNSYAVHADSNSLYNETLLIDNCVIKSDRWACAVGMGMKGGCHVTFKNSYFVATNPISPAVYAHDNDLEGYDGVQTWTMLNCIFYSPNGAEAIGFQSQGKAGRNSIYNIEMVGVRLKSTNSEKPYWIRNWYGTEPSPDDFLGLVNGRLIETSWGNSCADFNND